MRKIYSLVLMAAMLLLGTNSWAVDVQVSGSEGTAAELQAAIDAAASGTTLTLQHDFTLTEPVWLGTTEYNGDYKSITLDLNGHKIKRTVANAAAYMFILTHGELLVRNSSATTAEIQLTGTANASTQIFSVYGSYRSTRWNEAGSALETDSTKIINTRDNGWFSHLELGQNVKVIAGSGCMGTGIAVDVLYATPGAISALNKTFDYRTDIYKSKFGFAQGVKVDVYGDIEIAGKGVQGEANKAYCVKVNGLVYSPKSEKAINTATFFANLPYAQNFNVVGRPAHQGDTIDAPFIHVHSTANLVSDNKSTRSTAVYSSGYSRMLIEGYCEGSVGVYANSGKVEINDAEVVSTSTDYTTPTANGGAQGGGSAVVINTRDNYTGEIEVTISGDSKVTATTGYAIEEIVTTTADTTKVQNFTIEGGTIEGGTQGAIIVSDKTATDPNAEVVVYGGNISGDTQVGASGDINDILPTNGTDTTAHVTVVTDPVSGKTTIVVSEGAPVPASEKDKAVIAGDENTTVNWKHLDASTDAMNQTLLADMTLKELEINQNYNQTLTLGDVSDPANPVNVTLTVDHMVLGYNAQIVVNPGSKLIITGEQGITTYVTSNIVLKTQEGNPSQFLFNPAVKSNRHPNAIVEFITNSYTNPAASSTDYRYQRFGIPTYSAVTNMTAKDPVTGNDVQVFVRKYENNVWKNIGYINVPGQTIHYEWMNDPFGYYIMQCNAPEIGTVVTLSGELVGNIDANLSMNASGWNTYTNSYSANIKLQTMLSIFDGLAAQPAVYFQETMIDNTNDFQWSTLDYTTLVFGFGNKVLRPMEAFIIKDAGEAASFSLNYKDMVYDPIVNPTPGAPARIADLTKVAVLLYNGNNVKKDAVYMIQSDEFTSSLDNGYDSEKYMNGNVNLYITSDDKYATCATDNLVNTYLGFSCKEGGIYTLSFEQLAGEEFALVDLQTNAVVAMTEGANYQFYANDNETNDYRFKIISRQEMPTEVETVENNVMNAGGIYTITGQYLGTMNVWNSLPAGMYIVDGVKKVK